MQPPLLLRKCDRFARPRWRLSYSGQPMLSWRRSSRPRPRRLRSKPTTGARAGCVASLRTARSWTTCPPGTARAALSTCTITRTSMVCTTPAVARTLTASASATASPSRSRRRHLPPKPAVRRTVIPPAHHSPSTAPFLSYKYINKLKKQVVVQHCSLDFRRTCTVQCVVRGLERPVLNSQHWACVMLRPSSP